MRSWIGKIGGGVLATLLLAACSSTDDQQLQGGASGSRERTGTVGLKVVPVSGITLNHVSFLVTQGATTVSQGILPTPGTGRDFSFAVPLPVGSDYILSLSGESAEVGDEVVCTGSYGPFSVAPNSSSAFNTTLSCLDNSKGQILPGLDVATDACPPLVIDSVVATPSVVGLPYGTTAVTASARDLDNPAAVITYDWTIEQPWVADFTPASGASTILNCHVIVDDVRISVTASNGECSKSLSTAMSCRVLDECGDGIVGPGETCDPAFDPSCPADCTRVCGDGIAEMGEECDLVPPNPLFCDPVTCLAPRD